SDETSPSDPPRVLKRFRNPNRLQRYRSEVEAISRLSHPNSVKLIDYNLQSEPYYIVTEYCQGGCLNKAWLQDKTLLERLKVFQEICQGIAHAHANGVTHRDIKTQNIFLQNDGRRVVGDFGICLLEDSEAATETNEWPGARGFICPESETGERTDVGPSCDVYGLGKLLYWMVSGGTLLSREAH